MPVVPLKDDYIRHAIGVQRLASGTVEKTNKLFDALALRARVIVQINRATIITPSQTKIASLLKQLRGAVHETFEQVEKLVMADLLAFTDYESDFQSRLLQKRLGIPIAPLNASAIKRVAHSTKIGKRKKQKILPAFEGVTVKEALRDQEARLNKRIKKSVMLAIVSARRQQQEARNG